MENRPQILVIDDDEILAKALQLYLSRTGFDVQVANDALEGMRKLFSSNPDLVVLDVMMPRVDGFEACQRIRELSTVPIIMLTARGQESDRVRGLKLGADDYVAKPFSPRELGARVEAVLRRTQRQPLAEDDKSPLVTDGLTIDPSRWEVRRDGERLELTPTELKLLFYLADNAGRVLSHRQLLQEVWGPEYVDEVDYTKLFIWRLRQKIEPDPSQPKYILTERGIGYRFAAN